VSACLVVPQSTRPTQNQITPGMHVRQAVGEQDAFGTGSAGGQRSALLSPTKRNWQSSSGEVSSCEVSPDKNRTERRKAPSWRQTRIMTPRTPAGTIVIAHCG